MNRMNFYNYQLYLNTVFRWENTKGSYTSVPHSTADRSFTSKNTKKRHSQECLLLAAESAAPTTSSYDD